MVDVGGKDVTAREASAECVVHAGRAALEALAAGSLQKGDALQVARVAGIMAAKRTSELIPLCHPLPITSVRVDFELADAEIRVVATVRVAGRTGVEMEALTAVSVAALALIDMIKAVDPAAVISGIRVEEKSGGRSGPWRRPE